MLARPRCPILQDDTAWQDMHEMLDGLLIVPAIPMIDSCSGLKRFQSRRHLSPISRPNRVIVVQPCHASRNLLACRRNTTGCCWAREKWQPKPRPFPSGPVEQLQQTLEATPACRHEEDPIGPGPGLLTAPFGVSHGLWVLSMSRRGRYFQVEPQSGNLRMAWKDSP